MKIIEKCRHFNGSINEKCDAGVSYDSVDPYPNMPDGKFLRRPCVKYDENSLSPTQAKHYFNGGRCDLYSPRTKEDDEKDEKEFAVIAERMVKAMPLIAKIKHEHKGESWYGIEQCPVCDGKLSLSVSSVNNHTSGKCETPNCLCWIE